MRELGMAARVIPFNDWDFELQVLDQVRENVTDGRAKQGENDDNDDGDQNQNQRVFDETLTFFTGHVQHYENSWIERNLIISG